jgi:hypothetical protein
VTRARVFIFGAILSLGVVPWLAAPAAGQTTAAGHAILILVDGVFFEDAMNTPAVQQLARVGGVGLMTTRTEAGGRQAAERTVLSGKVDDRTGESLLLRVLRSHGVRICSPKQTFKPCPSLTDQRPHPRLTVKRVSTRGGVPEPLATYQLLAQLDGQIRSSLPVQGDEPILVLVVAPSPSPSMDAAGDEVTPIVMAQGPGRTLLSREGPGHTLTSDTTRQEGLVANVDVAPTVLRYFGLPVPLEMDGEPIRPDEGSPPFELHRLHLEQRSTRLPIQFGLLAFVVVAAFAGTWALVLQSRTGRLSDQDRRRVRVLGVLASSLFPALVVAGALPNRSYPWAVPGILISMAILTGLALAWRPASESFGPFLFLGMVGLGLLIVELALGGLALRVPLYGGTMFDGARFFGLPNAFLPFLLASALFVAAALDPYRGFWVLVGAGLVAGLPMLGADIGGSVTLFVAAGLWWVLTSRGSEDSPAMVRSILRTSPQARRIFARAGDVVFVVAVTVTGLVSVLLANRFLPGSPTHASRFVERDSGSADGILGVISDRLSTGFEMIRDVPAAVLPLIGFVIILVLAIRRVGAVGWGMEFDRRWYAIVVVACAASLVAYVANDTGAAAADPAFLYAMVGITYPAMMVADR